MNIHSTFLLLVFCALLSCKKADSNKTTSSGSLAIQVQKIVTSEYELYKVDSSIATLVLFPGAANTPKVIRREFEIQEAARQNGISLLLVNFSKHLWIDETQTIELAQNLESIFRINNLKLDNVTIGGMSIGGNVALTLSEYLHSKSSSIAPKGIFIIDSPIDLYALYESSIVDIKNPDLDEERLQEPRWIIGNFESLFGKGQQLLGKIEKVSPVTFQNKTINFSSLKDSKIRFYTEPDAQWQKEHRQTDFEHSNAYTIQQVAKYLSEDLKWERMELIETVNKGYRSNGERNPHSWSIVDVDDLIRWINAN